MAFWMDSNTCPVGKPTNSGVPCSVNALATVLAGLPWYQPWGVGGATTPSYADKVTGWCHSVLAAGYLGCFGCEKQKLTWAYSSIRGTHWKDMEEHEALEEVQQQRVSTAAGVALEVCPGISMGQMDSKGKDSFYPVAHSSECRDKVWQSSVLLVNIPLLPLR